MFPTKRQWRSWSLPSKLTLIGTYVGVLGVTLSIIFFFHSLVNSDDPDSKSTPGYPKKSIHLTGLLDRDEYLDEALLVFPGGKGKEHGLYLNLSTHSEEGLHHEIMDIENIGMNWNEEISMRFNSHKSKLVFKSTSEEDGSPKEKEITIKILKDSLLPALAAYKMKVDYKIICSIDYFSGQGLKDGVSFKGPQEIPLFMWDSSYVPADCQ